MNAHSVNALGRYFWFICFGVVLVNVFIWRGRVHQLVAMKRITDEEGASFCCAVSHSWIHSSSRPLRLTELHRAPQLSGRSRDHFVNHLDRMVASNPPMGLDWTRSRSAQSHRSGVVDLPELDNHVFSENCPYWLDGCGRACRAD